MAKTKRKMNKVLKAILIILISLILIIALYIIYAFASYKRIPDYQCLNIDKSESQSEQTLKTENTYKAISYNTGFSAYLPDFTFFMDGGSQSWAKSKESVIATTEKIANFLNEQNADFLGLQEVDSDSTRTYHVDETQMIQDRLNNYNSVTACCFDSPFLFWPILQPHGKSKSNIMTFSKTTPQDCATRRQFPVDEGLTKILDYDRCYSITRHKTENEHELVWYTTHMSAYSKDPSTAENQIKQIVEDMQNEVNAGNYVICAADFNKQIVDNPEKYFDAKIVKETEAFPTNLLEGTNICIVAPFDTNNPVGTCRDAGVTLTENTQVCNIDGFLISNNIQVEKTDVINTHFEYSDHNPVYMTFKLK